MTITEFLLARIAEDEDCISEDPKWDNPPNDMRIQWGDFGGMSDVLTIGEARLRAECQAKRRIVEQAQRADATFIRRASQPSAAALSTLTEVLLHLAQPYADHPDFREEWRS